MNVWIIDIVKLTVKNTVIHDGQWWFGIFKTNSVLIFHLYYSEVLAFHSWWKPPAAAVTEYNMYRTESALLSAKHVWPRQKPQRFVFELDLIHSDSVWVCKTLNLFDRADWITLFFPFHN